MIAIPNPPSVALWTAENIAGEELYDHLVEGNEDHFNLAYESKYAELKLSFFYILKNRYENSSIVV